MLHIAWKLWLYVFRWNMALFQTQITWRQQPLKLGQNQWINASREDVSESNVIFVFKLSRTIEPRKQTTVHLCKVGLDDWPSSGILHWFLFLKISWVINSQWIFKLGKHTCHFSGHNRTFFASQVSWTTYRISSSPGEIRTALEG